MTNINGQKGITLVEAIVAVAILAAAVAGPMTLASQSLNASLDARNELIASHLAEEGVEVIHNMRDNNSAIDASTDRSAWLINIMNNCRGNGCAIDVTDHSSGVWGSNATIPCTTAGCANESPVYFNPSTGLYRQSASSLGASWQQTAFSRVIVVTGIDDPATPKRQVHVAVTVTYVGYRGITHTITAGDDIYNWFPSLQ